MLKDITVLLSAAASPTMPGLVSCFKNNGERHIRIIGMDMADDASCNRMFDAFYCVPRADDNHYVDFVLDICKKENVEIYFPNISAEVEAVSKRENDFKELGVIVSTADKDAVKIANNKLTTYQRLSDMGIDVPDFYPVHTIDDFANGCKKLGYPKKPVCLKVVNNSGSRGVRIIDNKKNRYEIFAKEKPNSFFTSYDNMLDILKSADELDEMMLLEYLPGNEYTVDMLAERGRVLYEVGRENTASLMSIAQESIVNKIDSAYDVARRVVELLSFDGNIGIDFMKDENGVPKITDINPRITATVSVIAVAGVNLPYLRVKQLLGENLPDCNVRYGTRLKRRYGEYFTDAYGNNIDFY